jgi:hypothetical protein
MNNCQSSPNQPREKWFTVRKAQIIAGLLGGGVSFLGTMPLPDSLGDAASMFRSDLFLLVSAPAYCSLKVIGLLDLLVAASSPPGESWVACIAITLFNTALCILAATVLVPAIKLIPLRSPVRKAQIIAGLLGGIVSFGVTMPPLPEDWFPRLHDRPSDSLVQLGTLLSAPEAIFAKGVGLKAGPMTAIYPGSPPWEMCIIITLFNTGLSILVATALALTIKPIPSRFAVFKAPIVAAMLGGAVSFVGTMPLPDSWLGPHDVTTYVFFQFFLSLAGPSIAFAQFTGLNAHPAPGTHAESHPWAFSLAITLFNTGFCALVATALALGIKLMKASLRHLHLGQILRREGGKRVA